MSNRFFYLAHSCLCGKYLDEKDMPIDYKFPKFIKRCNTCKETLEWRVPKDV